MDRYPPLAALTAAIVGAIVGGLAAHFMPDPHWGATGSVLTGVFAGLIGGWPLKGEGLNLELGHPLLNAAATAAICSAGVLALLRLTAAFA